MYIQRWGCAWTAVSSKFFACPSVRDGKIRGPETPPFDADFEIEARNFTPFITLRPVRIFDLNNAYITRHLTGSTPLFWKNTSISITNGVRFDNGF